MAPPVLFTEITLGEGSTHTTCPQCQTEMWTAIQKKPSKTAYVSGFVIAMMGCILGCCLIPCSMNNCKNTKHFCPQCGLFLGEYKNQW